MKHEDDGDNYYSCCFWGGHQSLEKRLKELEIRGRIENNSDDYSVKINQNTEKSSVDIRRLDVTQTTMKDHRLTQGKKWL